MSDVDFDIRCRVCFKLITLTVDAEALQKYNSGEIWYVQDAFPHLSAGEREILISGTCESCFDKMFPEDEEW